MGINIQFTGNFTLNSILQDDHFLIPWDYELAGQVEYQTEWGQQGYLLVEQGRVHEVITQPSRPY